MDAPKSDKKESPAFHIQVGAFSERSIKVVDDLGAIIRDFYPPSDFPCRIVNKATNKIVCGVKTSEEAEDVLAALTLMEVMKNSGDRFRIGDGDFDLVEVLQNLEKVLVEISGLIE